MVFMCVYFDNCYAHTTGSYFYTSRVHLRLGCYNYQQDEAVPNDIFIFSVMVTFRGVTKVCVTFFVPLLSSKHHINFQLQYNVSCRQS